MNLLSRLLNFSLLILLALTYQVKNCLADNTKSLFLNNRSVEQLGKLPRNSLNRLQRTKNNRNSRIAPKNIQSSQDRNLVLDLQLDSVEQIINSPEHEKRFFASYRGLVYLKYFHDELGSVDFDESESRKLAEKVLIYQGARTITEFLIKSPLEDIYRRFIKNLEHLRSATTFTLAQDAKGSLDLGRSYKKTGKTKLMELSFRATPRSGIEPRLNIIDNINLGYNLLENQTLLFYEKNF